MKVRNNTSSPSLTEAEFGKQIEDLFKLYGWRWCHFRPAQTAHGWRTAISGDLGFPDYVAVKGAQLLIPEIKSHTGKLSDAQESWRQVLDNVPGKPYRLWRPEDLEGEILHVLSGGTTW